MRIIDQLGRLLSNGDGSTPIGLSHKEFAYTRQVESAYVERIEKLLIPVIGVGGIKAEVVAEIDVTQTEQSAESFTPDSKAVLSEQLFEEQSDQASIGRVPGALSNQPGALSEAPAAGGSAGSDTGSGQTSPGRTQSKSTRNFVLDRKVSHTVKPSGRVVRLSVAVVIDDHRTTLKDGTVQRSERTPEELARLIALVKSAIGFSADRGDSVNVTNAAFKQPEPIEALPAPPLWEKPWVWDVAKQALGALFVLILAFGVLRPLMRNLVTREVTERELEQATLTAQLAAPGRNALEGGNAAAITEQANLALPTLDGNVPQLEAVRGIILEDPKRVANVVKTWVNSDA